MGFVVYGSGFRVLGLRLRLRVKACGFVVLVHGSAVRVEGVLEVSGQVFRSRVWVVRGLGQGFKLYAKKVRVEVVRESEGVNFERARIPRV